MKDLKFKRVKTIRQPRMGAGYPDGYEEYASFDVYDAKTNKKIGNVGIAGTNFKNKKHSHFDVGIEYAKHDDAIRKIEMEKVRLESEGCFDVQGSVVEAKGEKYAVKMLYTEITDEHIKAELWEKATSAIRAKEERARIEAGPMDCPTEKEFTIKAGSRATIIKGVVGN